VGVLTVWPPVTGEQVLRVAGAPSVLPSILAGSESSVSSAWACGHPHMSTLWVYVYPVLSVPELLKEVS
jgi:hypothetical protein